METRFRRQLQVICVALMLMGIPVAVSLLAHPQNSRASRLKTQDTGYGFRFATLTQGTNHAVYSGNPALARVKWELYHSPFRWLRVVVPRSLRAERYVLVTPAEATVLWIGWTHRDYQSRGREGIPQPAVGRFSDLDGYLLGPDGEISPLRILRHSEAPFVKEFVTAYAMPAHPTNLAGGMVVLRQHDTQEDVAQIPVR